MTGIAVGMRGCTPDPGSILKLVQVGFNGVNSFGYDRHGGVNDYGNIDDNTLGGQVISKINSQVVFISTSPPTAIDILTVWINTVSLPQNFFRAVEFQRGNGETVRVYSSDASFSPNQNGNSSLWTWDRTLGDQPGDADKGTWLGGDLTQTRFVRFIP